MLVRSRDQQGFAHVGIIVTVVLFVGVLGLVAWRVWNAQQHGSPASSAVQQAIANAPCDVNDKDICKFYASWKATSNLKVSSTDVAQGKTTTSTFESSDSGKRFHMLTSVGGKPYETISIDTAVYTKDASGTWWKQTIEPSKVNDYKSDDYKYDFTDPSDTKDTQKVTYKALGKEACGNFTCFKYQVIDPSATDSTQYVWFDTKDYQLRRMRTENKDGSTSDQSFSYNNVSINVPSPVKELGPNQTLNPETGEVMTLPSQQDIQDQLNSALHDAQ